MTTYVARQGASVGRPPCASCGSPWALHRPAGVAQVSGASLAKLAAQGVPLACPRRYRPATLDDARDELATAEAAGDPQRVFVARGELQRLQGRPAR